jgi:hypothetical protein
MSEDDKTASKIKTLLSKPPASSVELEKLSQQWKPTALLVEQLADACRDR